jgi:hypothetical protein
MRNTGRLYAFDVSAHRLEALKPRLARSGLSNVHPAAIAHERDELLASVTAAKRAPRAASNLKKPIDSPMKSHVRVGSGRLLKSTIWPALTHTLTGSSTGT